MLCPQCRRQVGKDGYCPSGHLARPELQEQIQRRSAPPPPPPPPPAQPAPAHQPVVEADPFTPPGLGPSNPPPAAPTYPPETAVQVPPAFGSAPPQPGVPPAPVQHPFGASSGGKGKRAAIVVGAIVVALAVLAFFVLGSSAQASDLRVKFTSGETHTYAVDMTMTGRGGNLSGGFVTNVSIGVEMTQRTGLVDKDGNATLNYTLRNFRYSQNGRNVSLPAGVGAAFSVKMRPDGSVVGFDGGDPFGLEDVNPAAQFVNPSNASPILPKKKVVPGQTWTEEVSQELPDIGTLRATAVNTLLERKKINGNDAAVIRSAIKVPLDIRIDHDELVRQAKNDGDDPSVFTKDASVTMTGFMKFNFTQTIFTSNGLLQSALGDGAMTGTMTFGGIPGIGDVPIVFDLDFQLTMQKLSTGQSA